MRVGPERGSRFAWRGRWLCGRTGWATGPHLHYEFRVQGRSVDPTKIAKENPQVPSLKGADLVAFQSVAEDLRKRLSLLDSVNTAAAPTP